MDIVLPDSLQYELIKLVLTHEVGHTLGLEHNFLGSSHYSIEQLRDNEFLNRNGIGTSIMDYVRCNYALRPGDKVDLKNRRVRIGKYDRWAIEWGYRIFPGKDAREREKNRRSWNEKQQQNPWLHFSAGVDVESQMEDLGNDHVAINTQGIENLKYICAQPEAWRVADKVSLHVRKDVISLSSSIIQIGFGMSCRILAESALPVWRMIISTCRRKRIITGRL